MEKCTLNLDETIRELKEICYGPILSYGPANLDWFIACLCRLKELLHEQHDELHEIFFTASKIDWPTDCKIGLLQLEHWVKSELKTYF